jgi:hypothetical protein
MVENGARASIIATTTRNKLVSIVALFEKKNFRLGVALCFFKHTGHIRICANWCCWSVLMEKQGVVLLAHYLALRHHC